MVAKNATEVEKRKNSDEIKVYKDLTNERNKQTNETNEHINKRTNKQTTIRRKRQKAFQELKVNLVNI
jgi:hypothetical protein